MDVGFVGLGAMGRAMAKNIAKAGHRVRAWNRSPETVEGLEMVGLVAEAFQSDAVFTMLADDPAIRDVVLKPGVLEGAKPGLVHAVAATISVSFAGELIARHAEAGVTYLSTPVFGRPDAAEAGELNVMAGGDAAAIARIQPLLDVIGRKTWVMGEDPRQANAAKIAGNMMITMAIEAMAEAMVLTGDNGVTKDAFFELIVGTLFGGRAYQTYGEKIVKGDYEPGFRAKLGLKDLGLAAAAANTAGKRLPMLEAVRGRMAAAVDAGLGDKDWSVMADYRFDAAG
jgi:3-hydroxyisobutyrate dehydrogenase-like beta-hydroxyacid dehydrogenase